MTWRKILPAVLVVSALFSMVRCVGVHYENPFDVRIEWFVPGEAPSTARDLPRGTVGSPYDVRFIPFDVVPAPPNCVPVDLSKFEKGWAKIDESIDGLAFNNISAGEMQLSGVPQAGGSFEVSLTIEDFDTNGIHCSEASAKFTVSIDGGIHIETTSVPEGTVGQPYSATIAATGGISPYQWTIISGPFVNGNGSAGTPCEGLMVDLIETDLDTAVSGTPVIAGDCVFTIVVKDKNGKDDSQAFTLHVKAEGGGNPVPTISALAPTSAKAGDPAFTLAVSGTNFIPGSEVHWNSALRDTTFVSATEVRAAISSADIANPGTAQITVFNPAPGGGTSAAKAFPITAPPGNLERVSLSTLGEEGDSNSGSTGGDAHSIAVSQDGRFVVFTSGATNLAAGADNGGNNVEDVFIRDTCRGADAPPDCFKTTVRITGPAAPEPGNDYVDITADGQWITFTSSGPDAGVWVAPRSGGAAVRLTSTDAEVRFSSFINPAISDNGRFVAVETPFGFVPEDTNLFFSDIYLFDRDADGNGTLDEAPATITLISATPTGAAGNGLSVDTDVSADGRYVVFASLATDLVPASGSHSQVYLRDTCIGVDSCTAATMLISAGSAPGNALSRHPRITPDARYVAFDSAASNLLPPGGDTNAFSDIYVRDTCIGAATCTPNNFRVTLSSSGGETNENSFRPSLSADGRFVAYESQADNLVVGFPGSFFFSAFVTDTCIGAEGCTVKTNLLSQVDGSLGNSGSAKAVISPDGVFVDFESMASNLVTDDTNGVSDIFLSGTGLP